MAMLAEPRRKQRIVNLRAKNSAWSNDSNKFGQKMLEKMGWSAGKGLGANENGIVEHVVARYKNDEKGLGFEDKNDQWTKHEDDFNSLLANLSNGDNKTDDKLHSGESLEKKSKKSKARVHYHKFTRGKDISRYSEKELANIFGKKTFKETKEEPVVKDDVKTTEQIFTEHGSMEDYFKKKMSKIKSLQNYQQIDRSEDNEDYGFQGFSTGFSDSNKLEESNNQQSSVNYSQEQELTVKEKKKKKKCKELDSTQESLQHSDFGFQGFSSVDNIQEESVDQHENDLNNLHEEPVKEKKNKKKNKEPKISQEPANNPDDINHSESSKSKKKKNKKLCTNQEPENVLIEPESQNIEIEVKKCKKKKYKDVHQAINEDDDQTKQKKVKVNNSEDTEVVSKKKKKKRKDL